MQVHYSVVNVALESDIYSDWMLESVSPLQNWRNSSPAAESVGE